MNANKLNLPDMERCTPFDLERCKAGDPVVTREGYPYTFGSFSISQPENFQLIGWVNGRSIAHYSNGNMYQAPRTDPFDLLMAPRVKTIWGVFDRASLEVVKWGYDSFSEAVTAVKHRNETCNQTYSATNYFFKAITFEI